MRHNMLACLPREKIEEMTENVGKAIFAFKKFFRE